MELTYVLIMGKQIRETDAVYSMALGLVLRRIAAH
jgi:hypothetical protein